MGYFLALLVGAYLLGSVPSGLLVAWLMGGPDPRQAGSGNIGAANLYRLLGRNAGVFTLVGDAGKGAVPVFVARFSLEGLGAWQAWAVAAVGLVAVLGHLYPLYLGFKGGKGVATGFGVVATLCPLAALVLVVAYGLVVYYYRVISIGSLVGAWLLPIAMGLFADTKAYLVLAGLISVLILQRHRENIIRLVRGEEPRLGK